MIEFAWHDLALFAAVCGGIGACLGAAGLCLLAGWISGKGRGGGFGRKF